MYTAVQEPLGCIHYNLVNIHLQLETTSTNTHIPMPVLSLLPVKGRQQQDHNGYPKQEIKDVMQPHIHTHTH